MGDTGRCSDRIHSAGWSPGAKRWLSNIFCLFAVLVVGVGCLPKKLDTSKSGDGSQVNQDTVQLDLVDSIEPDTRDIGVDNVQSSTDLEDFELDSDPDQNSQQDVDSTPPKTAITSQPNAVEAKSEATFYFNCSESECSYRCRLDNQPWQPCQSPVTYTMLEEGAHTFQILSKDQAGNEEIEPVSINWTIDLTALDTSITEKPLQQSKVGNPVFQFTCNKLPCTYECKLDDGQWAPCTSGEIMSVSDGEHSFSVRSLDSEKNVDQTAALWTWTVDTASPTTLLDAQPNAQTNLRETSITFSCNEPGCSFKCQIDGGLWADCTSPYQLTLDFGEHEFRVQATDKAGNVELAPQSVTWLIIGWAAVSLGGDHSCGLKTDGTLWCWGDNTFGQLGNGETGADKDQLVPVQIESTTWKAVSLGNAHTCAIRNDDTLWCWGNNENGELGDDLGGEPGNLSSLPNQVGGKWKAISARVDGNCGIKLDGTLWCWGRNNQGRLGNDVTSRELDPNQLGIEKDWTDIAVSNTFGCGIRGVTTGDELHCWGRITSDIRNSTPKRVGTDTGWLYLKPGYFHICTTRAGKLWCLGDNFGLELGPVAQGKSQGEPVASFDGVAGLKGSFAPGEKYTCAVKADLTSWCWGLDSSGQFGTGTVNGTSPSPKETKGGNWVILESGRHHTCGIRSDNTLWCWGDGADGELGIGKKGQFTSPEEIKLFE